MIACLWISTFAAAVERRADPALRTAPLILVDPHPSADRVLAVSADAAQAGIEPGLSLRQARLLCPGARLIPANPSKYQRALDELRAVMADFASRLELELGELAATGYLELPVLNRVDLIELAQKIGQTVRARTGLAPALGLASGKFTAQVAAVVALPNKIRFIARGREAAFLAPRPIRLLPLTEELAHRFELLGLRTLGQLATLPAAAVVTQFGQEGRRLQRLARGQDEQPVAAYQPPAVVRLSHQLEAPVADRTILVALARRLATELARQLQAKARAARRLQLRLQLEQGADRTHALTLRQPTGAADRLGQILAEILNQAELCQPVTGLSISLTDLVPVTGRQLDLFAHGAGQQQRLAEGLPNLLARYGLDCFYEATVLDPLAYLLEDRAHFQPVTAP